MTSLCRVLKGKTPTTARAWMTGMATALLLAPALAAETSSASPELTHARTIYAKERSACLNGTSQQERAACLKEASAALAEARRSRLGNADDARALRRNAVRRCDAVPAEDRDPCRRMALGEGTVTGSAAAGGVIKELVSPEPAASVPSR
jgi:hypothetical protein